MGIRSKKRFSALVSIAAFGVLTLSAGRGGGRGEALGVEAYREGRFADALEQFREVERTGPRRSAEDLYNHALTALRAGAFLEAEYTMEKAVVRGGRKEDRSRRDFLFGNTAFARCEEAETIAKTPGADPTLLQSAISQALAAKRHWERAAMGNPDWPEARRNVERALLKIRALKNELASAQEKRRERKKLRKERPQFIPRSTAQEVQGGKKTPEGVDLEALIGNLAPEEVRQLFEKLDEKEMEKVRLRRDQRRKGRLDVEKDW